jgi:hypothetical protein
MRRGLTQKNDREQEQAADSDDTEKSRSLNDINDRLEGAGISSWHRGFNFRPLNLLAISR